MTANCSRSIATAISARLNAWRTADLGYDSVARRIVESLTRSKYRYLLLYPALLGLGAGALASCAGEQSTPPPQAAAVRPAPPTQALPPQLRVIPLPARKPTPPPPTGSPAPTTAEEGLAMAEPNPPAGSPVTRPPSPTTETGNAASQVELIGLDQSAATRLFGQAAERLEEPPATIWR